MQSNFLGIVIKFRFEYETNLSESINFYPPLKSSETYGSLMI